MSGRVRGTSDAERGEQRRPSDRPPAAPGRARPLPARAKSFVALVADSLTPLAVACAVLAVSPDFDNFFHTHRTWSHSLGAAAVVWAIVALVAWRLRLPVLATATICGAAYASHVLLDWLGSDEGPNGGLMALWPFSHHFYKSGANLFLELSVHPRTDLIHMFLRNVPALGREVAVLAPLLILAWMLRVGWILATPRTEVRPRPGRLATTERAVSEPRPN